MLIDWLLVFMNEECAVKVWGFPANYIICGGCHAICQLEYTLVLHVEQPAERSVYCAVRMAYMLGYHDWYAIKTSKTLKILF